MILYKRKKVSHVLGDVVTALAITFILIGIIYVCVRFNKWSRCQQSILVEQQSTQQTNQTNSRFDDAYHVGGITTEHFILILIETRSLNYAGYNFDVLVGKKTQTNYDAYALYDCIFDIFEAFDDILDLEYVEKGYGRYDSKGVEAMYDSRTDDMRINTYGVMLSGSIGEMRAFRNDPLGNVDMLDAAAGSNNAYDYTGDINDNI